MPWLFVAPRFLLPFIRLRVPLVGPRAYGDGERLRVSRQQRHLRVLLNRRRRSRSGRLPLVVSRPHHQTRGQAKLSRVAGLFPQSQKDLLSLAE